MPWSNVVRRETQNGTRVTPYALKRVDEPVDNVEERLRIPADSQGNRLDAVEQEAYQRGLAAGEMAGSKKGFQEIEAILLPIITEVKHLKEVILTTVEQDILQIALAVARQVLRQEIAQSPDVVLGQIREAIKKIGPAQTMTVRVPASHLERMTRERAQLLQLAEGVTWLKIEPDLYLQPGECIVESQERIVDVRLDSQLVAIEKGLLAV